MPITQPHPTRLAAVTARLEQGQASPGLEAPRDALTSAGSQSSAGEAGACRDSGDTLRCSPRASAAARASQVALHEAIKILSGASECGAGRIRSTPCCAGHSPQGCSEPGGLGKNGQISAAPVPALAKAPWALPTPLVLHPQPWHRTHVSPELRDAEMLHSAHKPPAFSTQFVCNPADSPGTAHRAPGLGPAHTASLLRGQYDLGDVTTFRGTSRAEPRGWASAAKAGTHLPEGGSWGSLRCRQLCPRAPQASGGWGWNSLKHAQTFNPRGGSCPLFYHSLCYGGVGIFQQFDFPPSLSSELR